MHVVVKRSDTKPADKICVNGALVVYADSAMFLGHSATKFASNINAPPKINGNESSSFGNANDAEMLPKRLGKNNAANEAKTGSVL